MEEFSTTFVSSGGLCCERLSEALLAKYYDKHHYPYICILVSMPASLNEVYDI